MVESGDGERREFEMHTPCIDVQNSSELRLVMSSLEQIGGEPPLTRAPRAGTQAATTEEAHAKRRKWRVSAADIALAHGACWDGTSGTPTTHRSC